MYVKFQGTITGDTNSGDVISQIEFSCRTGSDYSKGVAYGLTAGSTADGIAKTVVLQSEIDAIVAAFEGDGFMANVGSLVSGTTYIPCVKVTETKTGGTTQSGGWIDCSSSTPSPFAQTALNTPTIGTATASTKTLTWSAPSGTTPTGYKIYISTDSGATYPTSQIVGNILTWTFPAMTASTYRYKVSAINQYGVESAQSGVATAA